MEQWLKNIITILHEPKYPQIKGALEEEDDNGNIIGKCALGEIRCQVGASEVIDITDEDGIIMKKAGVPAWMRNGKNFPSMGYEYGKPDVDGNVDGWLEPSTNRMEGFKLQDYIWKLNDAGLNYDQIAEFLEVTFG